jgi:hypothetical protein
LSANAALTAAAQTEDFMAVLLVIFLVLLALKLMDLVKYAACGDANGIVTQIVAWALGVLVVYLALAADWDMLPGGVWPRILWGVLIGSAASTFHDLFKSIAKAWHHSVLLPDRTVAP